MKVPYPVIKLWDLLGEVWWSTRAATTALNKSRNLVLSAQVADVAGGLCILHLHAAGGEGDFFSSLLLMWSDNARSQGPGLCGENLFASTDAQGLAFLSIVKSIDL